MGIESKIKNSHLLINTFGKFPSFHDAEVLQVILDRGERHVAIPTLKATIHVFERTSQIDEQNKYVLENHMAVTFCFTYISQLSIANFNQHNVLQDLTITDLSDNQYEGAKFEVSINGIYGVTAEFQCSAIRVESVEPYIK